MPSIVRFEPLRDFVSLRDAMDRLVEDSFISPRSGWLAPLTGGNLAVDIYETDQEVVVKASLPGVKPEDIDISVTGDALTIKGELDEEFDTENACYHCRERRTGTFQRTVTLPSVTVPDQAEARFENGVLSLVLPKAEEVKPKSIKVKAGQ
jgi:HSP20 family protein